MIQVIVLTKQNLQVTILWIFWRLEFTYVAGKLGKNIIVAGDNLPRQIFGMFTALCSIVRMIYLSYVVSLLVKEYKIDLVVLDGISAPIPLLQVS